MEDKVPAVTAIGAKVRQVSSTPAWSALVDREATVVDSFEDENGNWHVKTDDNVWCLSGYLKLQSEWAKEVEEAKIDRDFVDEFEELYEDGVIDAHHWLYEQITMHPRCSLETFRAVIDVVYLHGKKQALEGKGDPRDE